MKTTVLQEEEKVAYLFMMSNIPVGSILGSIFSKNFPIFLITFFINCKNLVKHIIYLCSRKRGLEPQTPQWQCGIMPISLRLRCCSIYPHEPMLLLFIIMAKWYTSPQSLIFLSGTMRDFILNILYIFDIFLPDLCFWYSL